MDRTPGSRIPVSGHDKLNFAILILDDRSINTGGRGIEAGDLNTLNTKVLMQARDTVINIGNRLGRGESIAGPNGTSINIASMIATG